jgi:hypothetical protein
MMTPARAKDFRHIPDPCNANADGIPIFSFSNQTPFVDAARDLLAQPKQ